MRMLPLHDLEVQGGAKRAQRRRVNSGMTINIIEYSAESVKDVQHKRHALGRKRRYKWVRCAIKETSSETLVRKAGKRKETP